MKNNYIKFLSAFMITLILTLPIYSASVLAQFNDFSTLPDPVQSCIDKNEKTNELVELMENDIISTLEQLIALLHAITTIWETTKILYNTVILVLWATKVLDSAAVKMELNRLEIDNPLTGSLLSLYHYLVTCKLPDGIPSACNIEIPGVGNLNAFSNVYTAIGCLCLPAILSNMRTLQRIYVEHNCCVEQACNAGITPEACEATLDERICTVFGKGALFQGLVGLVVQAASSFASKLLYDKWFQENPRFWGTVLSLARAPFMIQSLISTFERLQNTFSEPTCENLGFEDIKDNIIDQQRNLFQEQDCRFVPVDLTQPPDGIIDDLIWVCEDRL